MPKYYGQDCRKITQDHFFENDTLTKANEILCQQNKSLLEENASKKIVMVQLLVKNEGFEIK